ncbi:dUTP diphosphatase [Candidatus Parcubacteria bacterium]|nr:dUTP diphosphatase [Candidatus Parcubacteria bacterium]
MLLKIKKISPDAKLPTFAHSDDAGMDLYSSEDLEIQPRKKVNIKTGVIMEIPKGYAGLIWDKGGIANRSIHTLAGVVDAGYRGEVIVLMINLSNETYKIKKGQKIAQMLIQKIERPEIKEVLTDDKMQESLRGSGKFGSTGLF